MPRNLPDNKCKHWPPFLPLINTAVQVVLLSLLRDSNIIRDVNAWFEEVYRIPSTIKILFSGNNHLATVLANFFSRKSKICITLEHDTNKCKQWQQFLIYRSRLFIFSVSST